MAAASGNGARPTEMTRTPIVVSPDNSAPGSSRDIHSLKEFKALARAKLPRCSWNYYSAGATDRAVQAGEEAFNRFYLRPRALHADSHRDQSVTVFGQRLPAPIGIAPTAHQCLAHPEAEVATARGAEKFGSVMIVSSWANTRIEDIVASAPGAILWMQLSIFKNPRNTINLVRRAERLGFRALVVTVDTPLQNKKKTANISAVEELGGERMSVLNLQGAVEEIREATKAGDRTLTRYMVEQLASFAKWSDIRWLKRITKLPVLVKGVLTAESAKEAAVVGVDGIIVSAHGGRQLAGVLPPIEALPEVVNAVKGRGVDVFVDGGVRSGFDVFKALSLGAKMVFVGRPSLWGLVVEGSEGVYKVLKLLSEELDYVMASCGCNRVAEITRSHVGHISQLKCNL